MSFPFKHVPPTTLKEWNDFNRPLNELLSGQLGPGSLGSKVTTEERGSQDDRSDARALFISGIALKQVAANLPEGNALASAADQAIDDWEDEYCGTPPRPIPTLALAVSLAAFASTLQAGGLQTAIQEEAGRIAQKAFAVTPAAAEQPTTVKAA
jgi:hypothetical protein